MDFEPRIQKIERDLKEVRVELEAAKKMTARFLAACQEAGISRVGIGKRDGRFKNSEGWPFSESGSVFADGEHQKDRRPKIWVAHDSVPEIHGSCGNSGQHSAKTEILVDGIYELRNGCWDKTS